MDIQAIKRRYDIVGEDPKLLMALSKAIQVAPTDLSILITGESGVGKDVFSRIIHDGGVRKHKRLVPVNCGAIPDGTIESELFGHLKGSFTGADKNRKGYFEEAHEGTIFLDEVGELPLSVQVKLLRVLENGEITPVGSSTPIKVNVRVVAATNVNLLEAVRNGRFREDLYYRLNQISISIPPLRERRDDIPLLFRKFSSDVAERYHTPPVFLTEEARNYLVHYPWYGNIRELRNITEQISVVETERTITLPILHQYLSYVPNETMPAVLGASEPSSNQISDRELLLKALSMGQMINEMRQEINSLRQALQQIAPIVSSSPSPSAHELTILSPSATNANTIPSTNPIQLSTTPVEDDEFQDSEVVEDDAPLALDEQERQAIVAALQRHQGHRKLAAADLHISERTLYRKIKEYGL